MPTAIAALLIAVYWAVLLWRSRSRPDDWTWPPAQTALPIRLTKRQFQAVGILGVAAALLIAVYAVLLFR